MAAKNLTMPKKKRCQKRGKITAYPEYDVEELYRVGGINGWDTAGIAKEALEDAFRARREELLKKADEA